MSSPIFLPDRFSSSSIEPMTTVSWPSAEIHIGIGVPQNRLRLTCEWELRGV